MSDSTPSLSSIVSHSAEEYVNDPNIEQLWASKAVIHMRVYFNLITSMPSVKSLKLTPNDDIIYEKFRKEFPDLNIETLTENDLKCDSAKVQWRQFCNDMVNLVEDFNFATMMRLKSREDYTEDNSIVVPRAQFVAIEIARNREGYNDGLMEKFNDN